ncbi:hypothetical protein Tco_0752279 [Tanacetum coccineum]|uniref:Uncharacterized protein n=1 Tax=Tanacetum coccineum TaxID=301880 RepID=A0ABQ4Z6E0_9ASTR
MLAQGQHHFQALLWSKIAVHKRLFAETEVGEAQILDPELIQDTTEKIIQNKQRLKVGWILEVKTVEAKSIRISQSFDGTPKEMFLSFHFGNVKTNSRRNTHNLFTKNQHRRQVLHRKLEDKNRLNGAIIADSNPEEDKETLRRNLLTILIRRKLETINDNESSDDDNDDYDVEKDEEDEHLAPADPSAVPTDDSVPSS